MGISTGRAKKYPTLVQTIQRRNDLTLVQWEGDDKILHRSWVRNDELLNEQGRSAEVLNPESGVPYGVEFWRLVKRMTATPKDFDRELKTRGIWTVHDVRTRPNEVISALMATYGLDLATLQLALDQYEKDLATEA